jgi:guanylate kinase
MRGVDFDWFQQQPMLIVISGPSAAGKDSVIQRMKERALSFHFVVTATTRPPRPDEQHGVNYLFISQAEFTGMIDRDELLEYATVYQDYKGVPKEQVRRALASGKDVVMRLDVQGAETVQRLCPEALLIFLSPPSEQEMIDRLLERKTETPADLELRIVTARQEIERRHGFDYVVVNRKNELDEAVDTILAIIKAEHHRIKPRRVTL